MYCGPQQGRQLKSARDGGCEWDKLVSICKSPRRMRCGACPFLARQRRDAAIVGLRTLWEGYAPILRLPWINNLPPLADRRDGAFASWARTDGSGGHNWCVDAGRKLHAVSFADARQFLDFQAAGCLGNSSFQEMPRERQGMYAKLPWTFKLHLLSRWGSIWVA